MTVPESAKQAIRNLGPAPEGDNGASNGYNPIGAMNRIEQITQIIEVCGYRTYTDLDPDLDRQAEYEDAWGKFKYRSRLISNVFSKDFAGKEDAIEVEAKTGTDADGNPVLETKQFGNPNGPSGISVESAELPDRLMPEVAYES